MAKILSITDKKNSRKVTFPCNPNSITFNRSTKYAQYDILDSNTLAIPKGTDIKTVTLDGTLFGKSRQEMSFIHEWMDPKEMQKIWSNWQENGTVLRLVIPNTPINMDVTIASYDVMYTGGYGDYTYTMQFNSYTKPAIVVTKKKSSSKSSSSTSSTKRASSTKKTYKIKSGDTLWGIAQKQYGSGSKWTKIYDANKSTIEAAAKKHRNGKGSDHGHWIYPGTVLSIPS